MNTARHSKAALPLLLLCLLASPAARTHASQSFQPSFEDPMFEPWRWRVFPELSGLGLQCITEGKNGTMWFGTAEGAWSYNGTEWTSYSLSQGLSGGVDTLCTGPDGTIYAGGVWGIDQFRNGRWTRLLPAPKQSFAAIKRLAVARDGSLWAATSWGALRHKNSDWVLYTGMEGAAAMDRNPVFPLVRIETLPDAILAKPREGADQPNRSDFFEVHQDHQGLIWLGTDAGEILTFKPALTNSRPNGIPPGPGGQWTLYNETDGLAVSRRPRILQLENGSVWVVNYGSRGRASQFDGSTWKSKRLQEVGVPDDCNSLLQTRDGVFWVGCNGAVAANRDGQWQVYEPPKVPIPTVRTILFQSADGALWIAGQDAEVLRLDYQTPRWTTYQSLNFQWESPKGALWFLHRDGRVVVHDANGWLSYGPEDGLMDTPTALLGTRNGEIWASGSHDHLAATARFDGQKWTRLSHEALSWGVDWRAIFESSDGSLWFGGSVDSSGLGRKYLDGIMQYQNGDWTHHQFNNVQYPQTTTNTLRYTDSTRSPLGKFYGIAQSRDGKIWGGQGLVTFFDGTNWSVLPQDDNLQIGVVEAMFTSKEGDLWIGSRQFGVFRYDGKKWQRFHAKNGLVANTIRSITQTPDGSIWVASDRGVSRFDGRDWTSDVLPSAFNMAREAGSLKASPSGALWINRFTRNWTRRAWPKSPAFDAAASEFWTVRFQMSHDPPTTSIATAPDKVAQPGNVTLSWKGTDPWRATRDARLQYSFRMDVGRWSHFSPDLHHSFFSLPSGQHHFQVRARDEDFNVDPRPASLDFTVLPPVWKQAWFIGLILALCGLIATQTARVVLRGSNLRSTNRALAAEVEERKRIQLQAEEAHRLLLDASHQAGMAEVATNILHNVGNVLNSVNVSADLVIDRVRKGKASGLAKAAEMLSAHSDQPGFLTQDEKGKQLPAYLKQMGDYLLEEQASTLHELSSLQHNVNHIKEIVAMQQQYSRVNGFTETAKITDLVEDALRLNEGALTRHRVQLIRDFHETGSVVVEKHKVLQILVNLIRNAKYACDDSGKAERHLTIRTARATTDRVQIQVCDNGVGIPAENLTRIFSQGFTTRKNGHGFGLHSSANAAIEIGGRLSAASNGPGQGAIFTLEFPIDKTKTG